MKKFELSEGSSIRDYYDENGYVVIKKLLSEESIESFFRSYRRVLKNPLFIYYSQSVHRPVRPQLTEHGFLKESMENPTTLFFFPGLTSSIKDCLFDPGVSTALTSISGGAQHVMRQNMFFDFSTGTIEHQDHWYLDTDPPGEMIGAWYALEDIQPEAGCFFVLPGSHKGEVLTREMVAQHEDFRSATMALIERNSYHYVEMPLEKGDVLFWHPYTIHGGRDNRDPRYSRKSFTAHFYPLGTRMATYSGEQSTPKVTRNPHLYTAYVESDLRVSLRHYLTYLFNWVTGKSAAIQDMRRASYS